MISSATPFKYYSGGVIDSELCNAKVDHAVLAVGYGKFTNSKDIQEDYFILKNSWGRYWGESGYARVSASTQKISKGMCGIYIESYLPYIEKNS